jgi:hypothetical protein
MIRLVLILSAAALLAASGFSHRLWTGEWNVSNEPGESASRLAKVPEEIGEWVGKDSPINESWKQQMARAEAVGYLSRHYVNRRTSADVEALIICGKPGPISVHTPDVCFAGIGFKIGSLNEYHFEGTEQTPAADFYWANFENFDPAMPARLRIYWGWKAGAGWKAPTTPRVTIGSAAALYKLYLIYRPEPGAELQEQDPCKEFMDHFLPELERTLSPAL